jgi:hypothetical protein
MAIIYSKWAQNMPTFSILKPYKIYPNAYFRFENVPSGNPACRYRYTDVGKGFDLLMKRWRHDDKDS